MIRTLTVVALSLLTRSSRSACSSTTIPKRSAASRLVFQDDKLWYGLVPASASELTPEKIESRFGRKPLLSTRSRVEGGDLLTTVKVFAYPDAGVAYLLEGADDFFKTKCVFVPVEK